jgi:glycosyltransferase involved in cell wall biosynthesis
LQKRIWITWETQRRSIELSKKFGCKFYLIEHTGSFRYPISILKTLAIIIRERPDVLFVQNPSMILALVACLCRKVWRYYLVVDRHTTFLLDKEYQKNLRLIMFKLFHRYTIKIADITIVTNNYLADLVKKLQGRPFVLPDIIPQLVGSRRINLKGKQNLLLISSFGIDEPIVEVLESMKPLAKDDIYLYITGNFKKLTDEVLRSAPPNIVFTGFLDEQDFVDMLFSVDSIMVLTTAESCMLCGCYEAVSVGKPLITSDKGVLRDYFKEAVFVDNTISGIREGVIKILKDLAYYQFRIQNLKGILIKQWEDQYAKLETKIKIGVH